MPDDVRIEIMSDTNELLDYIDLVKELPTIGCTHMDMIVQVAVGNYQVLKLMTGNKVEGIAIIKIDKEVCILIGINAKNSIKKYINLYDQVIREAGVKKLTAFRKVHSVGFTRLTGFKHIYSYYEKEI